MKKYISVWLLIFCISACENVNEKDSEKDFNSEIEKIFNDYHEFSMRNYPEWATYQGDNRYNDRLTDNSEAAIRARQDSIIDFLSQIQSIDPELLTDENSLNYELFISMLQNDTANYKFNNHYMPLTQQWGLHIRFPGLINSQPLGNYDEFQDYLNRLRGFEKQVQDVIENMRNGIESDIVQPKFLMEQVVNQIENISNKTAENNVFYLALKNNKDNLTDEQYSEVSLELLDIIENIMIPSYNQLRTFIIEEYLPACRTEDGIWSLPHGKLRYSMAIKHHTTLDMTPEEIFNTGMQEIERIKNQMEIVKEKIGYDGTLDEFIAFLRTDPQFYYTDKEKMLADYRIILDEMEEKLPQIFGRLPKAEYELKELEEYRAANAPQAYYYSAPEDRSRPAYFYVNTYDLSSRPSYTMTALALHEAVPGHHLQIAIAQEIEGLPWFRRNYSSTAFVEGWALYAEYLGYETRMYEDKYQEFGALTFEIWRACRLVVDVGLHYKQWTREQAVEFMFKNTPNSELDVRSEIDRYIARPGQALAYKIGELKIRELRKKAEEQLGNDFNLSEFHDIVIKNGAIPLKLLEEIIETYISENSRATS